MITITTLLLRAALAIAVVSVAKAADDSFVFSSDAVFRDQYPAQRLRLHEQLTLSQIKRRLPSYRVIWRRTAKPNASRSAAKAASINQSISKCTVRRHI